MQKRLGKDAEEAAASGSQLHPEDELYAVPSDLQVCSCKAMHCNPPFATQTFPQTQPAVLLEQSNACSSAECAEHCNVFLAAPQWQMCKLRAVWQVHMWFSSIAVIFRNCNYSAAQYACSASAGSVHQSSRSWCLGNGHCRGGPACGVQDEKYRGD